jgi:pyruvate dehydrogenase E1 component beta subunit
MSSATTATTAAAQTISFTDAYRLALDEALGSDPSVLLLGEDIADEEGGGVFKVTKGLSTKYGKHRVRTTPIAEEAILGAAVGAALAGMRPVAEIMLMNFVTVAMDQIVNHAAKLRFMSGGQTHVPITIRTRTGAGAGTAGQHSDMLEAWFAHVAGMKVVIPSSPADALGLLSSCIFDDDPCLFIEDSLTRTVTGPAPPPGHRVPLGKANIVRSGTDVSVVSYGRPIKDSLVIAERLAGEGISVEVVDLRTVSPLDTDCILKSVAKTRRAVVAHEAPRSFGVGAEVTARIQEHLYGELAAPVLRVASRDVPVPFAKVLEQEFLYKPSAIESAIRQTLEARKPRR